MLCLYESVHLLNRRGVKVHLIRTGADYHPRLAHQFGQLSRRHVTHLGVVDRPRLMEILKFADVLVQPGAADEFNDYRLPSKLTDFLALGRPLILPGTNLGLRLRDGIDALLLNRGDAAEIADRVTEVLRDANACRPAGTNARRFAMKNFNWQRSALDLEHFYRARLATRPTSVVPMRDSSPATPIQFHWRPRTRWRALRPTCLSDRGIRKRCHCQHADRFPFV